jgi:hypothetical protein
VVVVPVVSGEGSSVAVVGVDGGVQLEVLAAGGRPQNEGQPQRLPWVEKRRRVCRSVIECGEVIGVKGIEGGECLKTLMRVRSDKFQR